MDWLIDKFEKLFGFDYRCDKCPACWDNYCSYIGDGDCGCHIFGHILGDGKMNHCFLPFWIAKPMAKYILWKQGRYWQKKYEESERDSPQVSTNKGDSE